ncbi:unnamed protein product, partial [Laminaria digitata]
RPELSSGPFSKTFSLFAVGLLNTWYSVRADMRDRLQSAKKRAGGVGFPYQSSNDLMVLAEATVRTTMQQQQKQQKLQQQQQQSEVVEQLGHDVVGGVELHESEVVVGL